jgi:DNA (cytosine-5)-methyltransferase 1
MVGNAVPPRLAYHIALSIDKCFAGLLPFAKERTLALVGYVKSESDFAVIRNKGFYYIRGGNRPGAIQYGQLCKPIKWLVLHRNGKKELYELLSGNAERCNREDLLRIGFKPQGDEYWLFRIKSEVKDPVLISSVLGQIKTLRPYPQFVIVEK